MPLVVMCGFPASGKSKRAQEVAEFLKTKTKGNVHIVEDHPEGINRNEIYTDSHKERETRGNLKSHVQRLLTKDDIVIVDSMNYIKGFRYELYCVTKSCRTPHCVIYCVTNNVTSKSWNISRDEHLRYSDDLINELINRFECPSPNNRWDKPLITVMQDESLNCEDIATALFEQSAPPPNQSTQSQPLASTNFLYQLDKCTQDVVNAILAAQKTSVPGDHISVPDAKEHLVFTRTLTLAELQRHRRQFITYSKSHPVSDTSKIGNLFVQYLKKTLM
ncbi:protein kti12 homolog [Plakobranchus ocellatus]|uniref:Protein KTI12 homolog n=1 Tax=Plakobranchus ocellatus TaxID=259542 RepID=A0AAV4ABD7_9GAST|nr:protein kti12 homolog [Plakobranchus ocellatus]